MAKTQKEIDARLKAYVNGTVDSPYKVMSNNYYREQGWLPMEYGAIDVDLRYNAQCI